MSMKIVFRDRWAPSDFTSDAAPSLEPYLYVTHAEGWTVLEFAKEDVAVTNVLAADGAVLLVSRGGFTANQIETVKQIPGVGCCPISYEPGGALPELLRAFLNAVRAMESRSPIPWHLLKPNFYGKDDVARQIGGAAPVLSYHDDFDELWKLKTPPDGSASVVIWDATPEFRETRGLPLSNYLTAYDWAVALSLRSKRHDWRIVLMDACSGDHPHAPAVRNFPKLSAEMPWVSVFTPGQESELAKSVQARPHEAAGDLDLVRAAWRQTLCEPPDPRDRHAITNLVGLRMLMSGFGEAPPSEALEGLLQSVGLLGTKKEPPDPRAWVDPLEGVEHFVLVDDMADLGWTEFLSRALGVGKDRIKVFPAVDAACFGSGGGKKLVELIGDSLQNTTPLAIGGSLNEVLFLDLRLFAGRGRDKGKEDEREFFRALVKIAEGYGLFASDLGAVKAYIDGKAGDEEEEYHIALTLLPRLLAHADLKLPIVLFSTTGRKKILNRLMDPNSPNIIIDFDKPHFLGDSAETVVTETKRRFSNAMEKARSVFQGRRSCMQWAGRMALPTRAQGRVVEIFTDESGEGSPMSIGAIVLTHKTGDPAALFTALQRHTPPLLWDRSSETRGAPPSKPIPKRPVGQYETWLSYLDEVFRQLNVEVQAFALVKQWSASVATGFVHNQTEVRFRRQLADMLEAVLFDVVPDLTGAAEIRLHIATRKTEDLSDEERQKLKDRFHVRESGRACMTFAANEAWPVAAEVRQRRPQVRRPIEWARGATLNPPGGSPHLPSQIHHLADWISHFAWKAATDVTWSMPATARQWFEAGFLEGPKGSFGHWLTAARYAARRSKERREGPDESLARAVFHASRAAQIESKHPPGEYNFGRWVRPRAKDWANALDRKWFQHLCDLLVLRQMIGDN